MAAHHLAIAKATFAASLLRPDYIKVNRDDLPQFHTSFETAVAKCSPRNIQTCKQWLLEHIALSTQRTSAFGKYLTMFSKHISRPKYEIDQPSQSRLRLNILYLLNDILHHMKYHQSDNRARDNFQQSIEPFVEDLFQLAAAERKKRVLDRMKLLVELWSSEQYLGTRQIDQIRGISQNHTPHAATIKPEFVQSTKIGKEQPFLMPATHGDPSLAFYDLPAGNLMPHIIPKSRTPMKPDQIRALRFAAGPADIGLVNAIKDFMKDVEKTDNGDTQLDDEGNLADMDELGQILHKDEAGNLLGDTYYGWSRNFCEKMKNRNKISSDDLDDQRKSIGINNTGRSRSPRKRRRYSYSSRSSSRSQSYSRSRSRSMDEKFDRTAKTTNGRRVGRSETRSRSRSYSPDQHHPTLGIGAREQKNAEFPHSNHSPANFQFATSMSPPPPQPSAMMGLSGPNNLNHQNFIPPPLGRDGLPIPPPRPLNWSGPWPPPPPPPPPVYGVQTGFPSIPFPPLQPPHFNSQQFK